MKQKTVGYGYKLSSETWEYTLSLYKATNFHASKKKCLEEIKLDRNNGSISKKSKPMIFKVLIKFEK